MHRLQPTERRGGRFCVLCLSSLLVFVQISAAFTGGFSQFPSSGSEVEEIPHLGTWDALTLCIKDSKEERALERWLLCVEAVASLQTSGIPLYGQGSEVIKPKNEVFDVHEELSTLEKTKAQEGFLRGRMELGRPDDQLESTESSETRRNEFQKREDRKDGSEDGGLGLFKRDDRSKEMSFLQGKDRKVSGSREFGVAIFLQEEKGNAGFVSGSADASPIAGTDRASDIEGKERQDFLSYGADQDQGSASDSSNEVDQVLAGFGRREGRDDDLQDGVEKHIHVANSVTTEALNSCTSGFLSSQEGLKVERENVTSTDERCPSSRLGMGDAVTSAAVVGLLTLMLRFQRGRSGRESDDQREISTSTSSATVESSRPQVDRKSSTDTHKLSGPLGMAVAQVLYEVLEQNGDYSESSLSAESLSNLLESALKESLLPVLGNDRLHFVEKFRESFSSTYRTRESVRSAYIEAGTGQTEARQMYGRSWRGAQLRSRRESQHQDLPIKLGAAHKIKAIPVKVEVEISNSSLKQDTTTYFSTGRLEQDGRSNCGESSTGQCLGGNSSFEASQRAVCSQEKATSYLGEDGSQDEEMYSADDSSDIEDWIVLEERSSVHSEVGRKESSLDNGPSSYHSLDGDESVKGQSFTSRDLVDMSQNPHPRSCSVSGFGNSMDSQWEGRSVSSQGIATPRIELPDRTPNGRNYLDFTRPLGLDGNVEPSLRGLIDDSELYSRNPELERLTTSEDSRASSVRAPERNASTDGRRPRGEGSFSRSISADDSGNSDRMLSPRDGAEGTHSSGLSVQDALVLASSSSVVGIKAALERYDLFERSVAAQEQHNRLLAWEIQSRSQGLAIKQEHLHLQFETNSLMKENVELSRNKAEWKENELQDRKLQFAYNELSRTCADQLVAGLCVMLVVLGFSFWKFSYDKLSGIVTVCKPPVRETHQSGWLGTNWMYNSLNALTYQLQAFTCEVTKAGRMVVGLVLMAFVTSSLLRRSVTSSSQAMPATVIVIVLGCICGFVGKISIDSLGGSGLHWLVLWECLCFLHAFATCFTPLLYHLLNGPPPKIFFEKASLASRISSGLSRFIFHTILVFILPLMAGILPFASPEEIMQIFLDWWSPGTFHGKYRVHI